MEVTLKVEGVRELNRRLETLPVKIQRKIVRQALRDGAKVIREEARRRVPVDTGRLRRTLTQRKGKARRGSYSVVVTHNWKRYAGTIPFYGGYVEHGTRKMPPRPYLRSALDERRDEATRVVIRGIREGIEREVRKV